MGTVDLRAADVGRRQYGAATRRQLVEAGISYRTIVRRLADGVWQEPYPDVIDLGTHKPTWRGQLQRLLLAAGPDAAVSHLTAAHLHEFLDVDRPAKLDVVVPRRRHAEVGGVRLHTARRLEPDEIATVHGLRTTTSARTVYDLAPTHDLETLERWLADLARKDRASLASVGKLLDRHPSRPGRRSLVAAVQRLPADAAALGSPLEVLGVMRFVDVGARGFVLQHAVRDEAGTIVCRPDLAFLDVMTLVDLDGAAWHDVSARRAKDEAKRATARALGWHVEVLRRADLDGPRPREIVERVERLRRQAATVTPSGQGNAESA